MERNPRVLGRVECAHAKTRHVCLECREHQARFTYRGQVRADRNHTLCPRCFRGVRDAARAQMLRRRPVRVAGPAWAAWLAGASTASLG